MRVARSLWLIIWVFLALDSWRGNKHCRNGPMTPPLQKWKTSGEKLNIMMVIMASWHTCTSNSIYIWPSPFQPYSFNHRSLEGHAGNGFVLCRACAGCLCEVRSGWKNQGCDFPFSFFGTGGFPCPSALQGSKVLSSQLQLALSILFQCSIKHEELSWETMSFGFKMKFQVR